MFVKASAKVMLYFVTAKFLPVYFSINAQINAR
jgi:hypothetical protein